MKIASSLGEKIHSKVIQEVEGGLKWRVEVTEEMGWSGVEMLLASNRNRAGGARGQSRSSLVNLV